MKEETRRFLLKEMQSKRRKTPSPFMRRDVFFWGFRDEEDRILQSEGNPRRKSKLLSISNSFRCQVLANLSLPATRTPSTLALKKSKMAISERQVTEEDFQGEQNISDNGESDIGGYGSSDSDEDPTYNILEETRSGLSKLSIKKSKCRIPMEIDLGSEGEPDDVDIQVPKLNENDEKSYEKVETIIQAGQIEKLKVEQCKVYLRKNGLRLTGKKDTLIERIREHTGIINGGGEAKYPVSSFVLNCKGDACTGDVVMFEQNVYEMFSIASRSATGAPCGTRIVVGHIVKESYGAAKQQHTFTIEVLWSKGEKPLPPLHPLLIKGRNLYRLKTMRQRWADEGERRRTLLEKHSRGSLARSNRETRIQEKETRKMHKGQRVMGKENSTIQEWSRQSQLEPFKCNASRQPSVQHQQQQHPVEITNLQEQNTLFQQHPSIPQNIILTEIGQQIAQPQPKLLETWNSNARERNSWLQHNWTKYQNSNINTEQQGGKIHEIQNQRSNEFHVAANRHRYSSPKDNGFHVRYPNANGSSEMFHHRQPLTNLKSYRSRSPQPRWGHMQPFCRFYTQGRCYYGDNCKYLHESRDKCYNGERK
ncbi:hypothetical protein HHK36_021911 [Tetracentron sinense]|uniref:Uncharacterized protein n=1 Tax=Tetracentron sinense TaxID=13715 RepID=A0A834YT11_TETSI|nr:hypothetical protein HHK36_021911 [Tetracentron sinense]